MEKRVLTVHRGNVNQIGHRRCLNVFRQMNWLILGSQMIIAAVLCCYQSASAMASDSPDTVAVYASPNGNDSWTGELSEPNSRQTDGPKRTLQAAIDRISLLAEETTVSNVVFDLIVRGGFYFVPDGVKIHFVPRNGATLEIRNYPGEFVTVSGGVRLNDFTHLSTLNAESRIPMEYKKYIYVFDLKKAGIEDYGRISQRGDPPLQLFFDDTAMTLARFPNSGWLTIAGVPQSGAVLYNLGLERERRYNGVPVGRNFGKINYPGDRPARWDRSDIVYVHGYWTWDWYDSYKRVDSVDTLTHELSLSPAADPYGYTKGQRFYFLNIPEELDSAGEWYLDHASGLLYFWPPRSISANSVSVSVTDVPLLLLSDCVNVTVSGIYFDISRSDGVVIDGGAENSVNGCLFRNLGGHAVDVNGGSGNGVKNSIVSDIGLDAIVIEGGDRQTLLPGKDYAVNNDIDHFGTWLQTVHGITAAGVGNIVSHNEIYDAPFEGLYLSGNNHLVEYNDFHDICRSSGDAGALHTGRDWTWRGNVIKYNYFHDLKGPGLHGVMGVYLDDWATGFTVYGNVFDSAGHAVFIGGGRDNIVRNNVFIGCMPSISIDGRGFGWASYYFNGAEGTELFDKLLRVKYWKEPYKSAYPQLATLSEDDPANPSGNVISANVSCGGRWMEVHDYGTFNLKIVTIKDNVIADPEILKRRLADQIGWDPYYLNLETDSGYVILSRGDSEAIKELPENSFAASSNVASISDGKLVISLKSLPNGFQPIHFSKIGTRDNHFRRIAGWLARTVRFQFSGN